MAGYEHTGDSADLEAIDEVRHEHVAALNTGDAQRWVAQFTEDGVQMPPNSPANVGRPMMERWAQGFLDHFRVRFDLDVDEVRVLGNWAFERGAYSIGLSPKAGGQPIQDAGKYITVYQRTSDGTWRMARDIWNSDNPPQPG